MGAAAEAEAKAQAEAEAEEQARVQAEAEAAAAAARAEAQAQAQQIPEGEKQPPSTSGTEEFLQKVSKLKRVESSTRPADMVGGGGASAGSPAAATTASSTMSTSTAASPVTTTSTGTVKYVDEHAIKALDLQFTAEQLMSREFCQTYRTGGGSEKLQLDLARREMYLSEADFKKVLGMERGKFQHLPAWKQRDAKKRANLF